MNEFLEKRKYSRMYFSVKDGIVGSFTVPGLEKELLSGSIMDISEGGLCMSFTKNLNVAILEGGQFLLRRIKGTNLLRAINDIDVIIKWIIELENSKNITFGCEFINISEDERREIDHFINSWKVS